MNNELLLLSGEDIPFPEAQITIHQPKLREISMIGEENFLAGLQFLLITKNKVLTSENEEALKDKTDFDIFLSAMSEKGKMDYRNSVTMLLSLIFPEYKIKFTQKELLLGKDNMCRINNENYPLLADIVKSMFDIEDSEINGGYNPVDARAKKIAEKLNKRKSKNAPDVTQKVAIYSRYASILSVGLKKDLNDLMNYTVYQLKDEFKRFQLKQSYDIYIQAKMAGAKDLEEVENWMDDIHK